LLKMMGGHVRGPASNCKLGDAFEMTPPQVDCATFDEPTE